MNQLGNIMKQAQQMQAKLMEAQNKIAALEVEGVAGGGMVKVKMNGANELLSVNMDKSLLTPDSEEILSDLIVAAFSDAKAKLDEKSRTEMSVLNGILPNGMKLPF